MNYAIVKSTELGNCWKPCRFIKGSRCNRVESCAYPEKKTCKAVGAEVDYLNQRVEDIKQQSQKRIKSVTDYRDKLAKGEKTNKTDKKKAGQSISSWQDGDYDEKRR